MEALKDIFINNSENDELLINTSKNIIYTTGGLYLAWYFIATLAWSEIFTPKIWYISISMLLLVGLSTLVLKHSYLLTQLIWQLGLGLVILLGYALFQAREITIFLVILPLVATVTIGRWGTILVEGLIFVLIAAIQTQEIFRPLLPGYATAVIFGSVFMGFFGWGLSNNLLSALSSASYHYNRARELLEETRHNQAQISRMLKEQNQANYQLERLNQMLQYARSQADDARMDRDRFILAVSHELRSPLNFILGFSDLMVNAPESYANLKEWPPGLFEDVQEIYRSSTHLLSLINDILDLGQIEAKKMTIYRDKASLPALVEDVIQMVEPAFHQKGLWVRTSLEEDLPPVFVDSTRVRQVILNLVNNGLRFTKQGGVTIRVQNKIEKLLIEVEDTGTGINADDIPKVFDPFRQVGQDSWRRREGSGLGLAISQRFIELHEGEMWLESKVGKGSKFYFTIPVFDHSQEHDTMIRQPESRGDLQKRAESGKPLALLLVSDSLSGRVIQESLENFKTVSVYDIQKVPQMVSQLYPQAIFVDKSIPLNEQLRLRSLPYDLPVIGICLPAMADGCQSLPKNIHDYLIKPIPREDLIHAVQRLGKRIDQILVVDDDPAMVRFVTRALKTTDWKGEPPVEMQFLTAYTGQQALAHLDEAHVDAILLDLDLPDISGWDVLSELRRKPELAGIPTIIISAMDFPQNLYTNGRQVFDVMMRRPFSKQEMSAILTAILENVKPVYPKNLNSATPAF